eukprot:4561335-Alexandrium_andersonii.AAC.1
MSLDPKVAKQVEDLDMRISQFEYAVSKATRGTHLDEGSESAPRLRHFETIPPHLGHVRRLSLLTIALSRA